MSISHPPFFLSALPPSSPFVPKIILECLLSLPRKITHSSNLRMLTVWRGVRLRYLTPQVVLLSIATLSKENNSTHCLLS